MVSNQYDAMAFSVALPPLCFEYISTNVTWEIKEVSCHRMVVIILVLQPTDPYKRCMYKVQPLLTYFSPVVVNTCSFSRLTNNWSSINACLILGLWDHKLVDTRANAKPGTHLHVYLCMCLYVCL